MGAARPIYENAQSLEAEAALARVIEAAFGCVLRKLERKFGLDFVAMRNERGAAFIEAKVRTNAMGRYPTYMVSMHKAIYAESIQRVTGLPTLLVVQWTDAIGYAPLGEQYPISFMGRTDRGDPADVEPVCLIPIEQFKRIKWPTC
jgi:hypothetical protein